MAFVTGEQRQKFEGNRGTKTILGNREHKKTNFQFLGNRGKSQYFFFSDHRKNPDHTEKETQGYRQSKITCLQMRVQNICCGCAKEPSQ